MADKPVRKKTVRKKVARKTTRRKAPTRASSVEAERSFPYAPVIAVVVFALVLGGSIAVGMTDSGAINVSDTITEQKGNATGEDLNRIKNVPVQQAKPRLPDGGLVPTTNTNPTLAPPVESKAKTSTSTEATASTSADTNQSNSEHSEDSEEMTKGFDDNQTESATSSEVGSEI